MLPFIFDIKTKEFFKCDFSFTDQQKLSEPHNGLFAFLAYNFKNNQPILVLNELRDYCSNHAGLHSFAFNRLKHAKKATQPFPSSLFSNASSSSSTGLEKPIYGGEILLLDNEIMFWNCKSEAFSKGKAYDDQSITPNLIKATGLPACYVKAKDSQEFADTKMKSLFNGDGSYRTDLGKGAHNPTPKQIAEEAKETLGLNLPRSLYVSPSPPATPTLCLSVGTAAG